MGQVDMEKVQALADSLVFAWDGRLLPQTPKKSAVEYAGTARKKMIPSWDKIQGEDIAWSQHLYSNPHLEWPGRHTNTEEPSPKAIELYLNTVMEEMERPLSPFEIQTVTKNVPLNFQNRRQEKSVESFRNVTLAALNAQLMRQE